MTSVLKRDEQHDSGVRALNVERPATPPSAAERHILALEAEVQELHDALRDMNDTRLDEIAAAREAGRLDAHSEFKRNDAEALAKLESCLAQSAGDLDAYFNTSEKLGLTFALAALEKVLIDPARRRELVIGSVSQQIQGLRSDTLLCVRVSAEDFADERALADLARTTGTRAEISVLPELASGECRLELRLGEIEISIPEYWERIRAHCRQLLAQQ